MPAVLVHGVMDTHRIWSGVRRHLARADVLAPNLPGFDAPVPAGFDASKEAYVDWLVGELETLDEPADLVGHDFGCIFAARVGRSGPTSSARSLPSAVRSTRPTSGTPTRRSGRRPGRASGGWPTSIPRPSPAP